MDKSDRWLLPEGIEEVLPDQARCVERLRRRLLDLFDSWGYELVIPPFIEYLESLLTGTGNDLDLQTFKLTDQLTGRMMGVRADITPQVARIDAHQLKRDVPTRLCYLGTVLHTRPDGFAGSRSPLQIGLELYGHAGIDSDLEVLQLMVATLRLTGIEQPWIDLGNVAIFRGLARQAGLDAEQEDQLFDALQRKAVPEFDTLMSNWSIDSVCRDMLRALIELNGGDDVLQRARKKLATASAEVLAALTDLENLAVQVQHHVPGIALHFDLAELRGYAYHTGVVFGAFVPGHGQAIASGGRYDDIGKVFGRARPATGFSADLKTLIQLASEPASSPGAVFASISDDPKQAERVQALRGDGERVIQALADQAGDARAMGCDRQLVLRNGEWQVESI